MLKKLLFTLLFFVKLGATNQGSNNDKGPGDFEKLDPVECAESINSQSEEKSNLIPINKIPVLRVPYSFNAMFLSNFLEKKGIYIDRKELNLFVSKFQSLRDADLENIAEKIAGQLKVSNISGTVHLKDIYTAFYTAFFYVDILDDLKFGVFKDFLVKSVPNLDIKFIEYFVLRHSFKCIGEMTFIVGDLKEKSKSNQVDSSSKLLEDISAENIIWDPKISEIPEQFIISQKGCIYFAYLNSIDSLKAAGLIQEALSIKYYDEKIEILAGNSLNPKEKINSIVIGDHSLKNNQNICLYDLIEEYENNKEFREFIFKLKSPELSFVQILTINYGEKSINCIVNKKENNYLQFYFVGNFDLVKDEYPILRFINFLESKKTLEAIDLYRQNKYSSNEQAKSQPKSQLQITAPENINFDLKKDFIGKFPEEIAEIIDYLNDTKRYTDAGLKPFNTMLLYGPPGTGKTSMASGIAKATNRQFVQCSASLFINEWQGSGSKSVKNLFDTAIGLNKPVLLFIDEVDTVSHDRSKESSKEYQNTLMSIVTCIDKLLENDKSAKVFVVVATNRFDSLDQALKSRFLSKSIKVDLPNCEARKKILEILLSKFKTSSDLIDKLAYETIDFSVRDLINVVNSGIMSKVKSKLDDFTFNFFEPTIRTIKEQIKVNKEEKDELKFYKNINYWNTIFHYTTGTVGLLSSLIGIYNFFSRN